MLKKQRLDGSARRRKREILHFHEGPEGLLLSEPPRSRADRHSHGDSRGSTVRRDREPHECGMSTTRSDRGRAQRATILCKRSFRQGRGGPSRESCFDEKLRTDTGLTGADSKGGPGFYLRVILVDTRKDEVSRVECGDCERQFQGRESTGVRRTRKTIAQSVLVEASDCGGESIVRPGK